MWFGVRMIDWREHYKGLVFDMAFLGRHAHQLRSEMQHWPISEIHQWVENTSKLIEMEYPKET